jgi:hypothetical protein
LIAYATSLAGNFSYLRHMGGDGQPAFSDPLKAAFGLPALEIAQASHISQARA